MHPDARCICQTKGKKVNKKKRPGGKQIAKKKRKTGTGSVIVALTTLTPTTRKIPGFRKDMFKNLKKKASTALDYHLVYRRYSGGGGKGWNGD